MVHRQSLRFRLSASDALLSEHCMSRAGQPRDGMVVRPRCQMACWRASQIWSITECLLAVNWPIQAWWKETHTYLYLSKSDFFVEILWCTMLWTGTIFHIKMYTKHFINVKFTFLNFTTNEYSLRYLVPMQHFLAVCELPPYLGPNESPKLNWCSSLAISTKILSELFFSKERLKIVWKIF